MSGTSRAFTNSTNRIVTASTLPAAGLRTYSLWMRDTGTGSNNRPWTKENDIAVYAQVGRWEMVAVFSTTLGLWRFATPSGNVWHNLVLAYNYNATANDPLIWLDGVSQSVTRHQAPVGSPNAAASAFTVGNRVAGDRPFVGQLAHAAVWNGQLSGANISALAAGANPYTVDAANLVFYLPIYGDASPEPDLTGNGYNGTVTGTSKSAELPSVVPPPATSPAAAALSDSSIRATWSDISTGETGYRVERSPNGSTGWADVSGNLAADTTTYDDTGLDAGTQYFYRVVGFNAAGDAEPSSVVNATTTGAPPSGGGNRMGGTGAIRKPPR